MHTIRHHLCGRLPRRRCGASGRSTFRGLRCTTSSPHQVKGASSEDARATMRQLAQLAAQACIAHMGEARELYGAVCPVIMQLRHLSCCWPFELVGVQQPGDQRLHWLPHAVDGTCGHEASHIHCTLRGTGIPDHFSSWWLLGGNEEWATLYAATREMHLDEQLWGADVVIFEDANRRRTVNLVVRVCQWQRGQPTPSAPCYPRLRMQQFCNVSIYASN